MRYGTFLQYCGAVPRSPNQPRPDACPPAPAHLLPVLSILLVARLVVAELPVHEEDGKVGDVKVGDRAGEPAGEAPGPAASGEARRWG